jgi:hypothetical protein
MISKSENLSNIDQGIITALMTAFLLFYFFSTPISSICCTNETAKNDSHALLLNKHCGQDQIKKTALNKLDNELLSHCERCLTNNSIPSQIFQLFPAQIIKIDYKFSTHSTGFSHLDYKPKIQVVQIFFEQNVESNFTRYLNKIVLLV